MLSEVILQDDINWGAKEIGIAGELSFPTTGYGIVFLSWEERREMFTLGLGNCIRPL